MSFYTGKDNSNNAIMHITNGVTPKSAMKAGVLANSVFHSSLPYLDIKEYVPESISYRAQTYKLDYGDPSSVSRLYKVLYFKMGIDFINSLEPGQSYFVTLNNRVFNLYSAGGIVGWCTALNLQVDYLVYSEYLSYRPTHAYPVGFIIMNLHETDSSIPNSNMIYNASSDNDIKVYKFKNLYVDGYRPFAPTNNEIFIDNNNFIVRGKDLYDTSYIQKGVINSVDEVVTTSDLKYQLTLVNTRATGPLSIHSHATESKIMRGEHTLFTSLQQPKSKYAGVTTNVNATINSTWVNVNKFDMFGRGLYRYPTNFYFSEGDMFVLVPVDSAINNSGQLFVFTEGYIGFCLNMVSEWTGSAGWVALVDSHCWLVGVDGRLYIDSLLKFEGICDWVKPYSFLASLSVNFNVIKFY